MPDKVTPAESLKNLYSQLALAKKQNNVSLVRKIELVIKRIENGKQKNK